MKLIYEQLDQIVKICIGCIFEFLSVKSALLRKTPHDSASKLTVRLHWGE